MSKMKHDKGSDGDEKYQGTEGAEVGAADCFSEEIVVKLRTLWSEGARHVKCGGKDSRQNKKQLQSPWGENRLGKFKDQKEVQGGWV